MAWLLGLLALVLLGLATPSKGDRLLDVVDIGSSVSDWRASASGQVCGVREGGHRKACVAGVLLSVFGLFLLAPAIGGAATRSLPALAQLSPNAGRAEVADPMAVSASRWASAIGDRLRYDWPSTSTATRQFVATNTPGVSEGIVEGAGKGSGNFGLGRATEAEAEAAGRAWVEDGYRVASDGKTLVSKDGLRQYRPPSVKPKLGITQANFESRPVNSGPWQTNGHVDIKP